MSSARLTGAPACPRRTIAAQRLIKSSAEAKLMLRAATVAGEAINAAMACTRQGDSFFLNSFIREFISLWINTAEYRGEMPYIDFYLFYNFTQEYVIFRDLFI